MYQAHFQLEQEPFSIAPDPSFLYLSTAHREALAHLTYGFSHGGFVLITGEVGTGKTTLLRNLIKQTPSDVDVAFILNPRLTVRELLETVCDELGVYYDPATTSTVKLFIDALNKHLLKTYQAGRSTVMIIDEAQNLSPAVLEQIRLLTNLETDEHKLLRIILLGQPELADLLDRSELRQLAQRITARYHLSSLSRVDTYAYIVHRLSRAGGNPNTFTPSALRRLYSYSKGIPRIINVIADRAMLGAYSQGKHRVSGGIVARAAKEVLGNKIHLRRWVASGVVTVCLAGVALAYLSPPVRQSQPPPAIDTSQAPADARLPVGVAEVESVRATQLTPVPMKEPESEEPRSEEPELVAQAISEVGLETDPQISIVVRPADSVYSIQRQAYAAVFERWGADFATAPSDLIPCDFAPTAGLQCLATSGDWNDIEQLNRPVVLELWDEKPNPYYAALVGLTSTTVVLNIGGQEIDAPLSQLQDAWYGSFVILWQTPPGYHGSLRRGDFHETVGWLRRQIVPLAGEVPPTSDLNYFDEVLYEVVVQFQRDEGLLTDGVVGPATWIRLAGRLKFPAPVL